MRKFRLSLKLLFAFTVLGSASLSFGQSVESEDRYQDFAYNLSEQFIFPIDQIGGSCHIHSSVALIEAACYRATGNKVNISEAFAFSNFLIRKIQKMGAYNFRISVKSDSNFTNIDGGKTFTDLLHLLATKEWRNRHPREVEITEKLRADIATTLQACQQMGDEARIAETNSGGVKGWWKRRVRWAGKVWYGMNIHSTEPQYILTAPIDDWLTSDFMNNFMFKGERKLLKACGQKVIQTIQKWQQTFFTEKPSKELMQCKKEKLYLVKVPHRPDVFSKFLENNIPFNCAYIEETGGWHSSLIAGAEYISDVVSKYLLRDSKSSELTAKVAPGLLCDERDVSTVVTHDEGPIVSEIIGW